MKIVYCTDSIFKLGGVEIVTIAKANALAAISGNQVWIAVADNRYSSITRLKKVSVLDLAVHYYNEDDQGYWHAIKDYWKKRRCHRQRLESILNDVNPDVVISTGFSTKRFLTKLKLKSNPVFILELHASKHIRLYRARRWREKIVAGLSEFYDNIFTYKKYDQLVLLTEAEKNDYWAAWDNITVIPDPLCKQVRDHSKCQTKVAVSAARLVWNKNYKSLINIWKMVIRRHPDWILQIWGEGPEEKHLMDQINLMELNNHVFLMGFTPDVQKTMAEASLFVLTSLTEGFSLVTLEAMSVGVPSVAYSCPGGLRDVLKDGETGFLVPLNDENAFAEKVCTLIENEDLRRTMGQAALKEVEQYRIEKITQRWMDLFQELLDTKRGKETMLLFED